MIETFLVVAANAGLIAAACALFALIGWLWFRPGALLGLAQTSDFLSRLAIYPLLGWMLALVGANWLRIPAVPLRQSAPFLLVGLFAVPAGFWLWRFYRAKEWPKLPAYFRPRLVPVLGLLVVVAACGLIPVKRLTVPSLYDVGVWGYDQVNYVHIADQYLEGGMFTPKDVPSAGILAPWVAFNSYLVEPLFARGAFRNDVWEFSANPEAHTVARRLGLIMRSGGAAMDATLAAWFRLDGLQAYVLTGYAQFLFLGFAGFWVGTMARIRLRWRLVLAAMASLWPIAVFPSLLDNRDQALALPIILVLLGAICFRGLNPWARGLALGALALTYIEILPLTLPLWLLMQLDHRPWLVAGKRILAEGGIALGCSCLYVPWGTHFLLSQLTMTDTMKLQLPMGTFLGVWSNFAGTFTGMFFQNSQILLVQAVVAGLAMITLQLLGLGVWLKKRRFFSAAGFCLLAGGAIYLARLDYGYAAYKFFTVLFPGGILLVAGCFASVGPVGNWMGRINLRREDVLAGLTVLCLPGILIGAAMRSGFSFDDLRVVMGTHSMLEDRAKTRLETGLTVRSNDLATVKRIVGSTKKSEKVLFSNFERSDVAYVAHFFGRRPVSLLRGLNPNVNPTAGDRFDSNMTFLRAGRRIDQLWLLNDSKVKQKRYDTMNQIVLLEGRPVEVETGHTFTFIRLDAAKPFAFVQGLFTQFGAESAVSSPATGLMLGNKGIAFGVYFLNGPMVWRTLEFDVVAATPEGKSVSDRIGAWKCLVNGKPAEGLVKTPLDAGVHFRLVLPPDPTGHIIQLARGPLLPLDTSRGTGKPMDKVKEVYRMTNFTLQAPQP